jgi:hypothetical protein
MVFKGEAYLYNRLYTVSYTPYAFIKPENIFMRNFKEFRIWQKGIDIAVKTFQ